MKKGKEETKGSKLAEKVRKHNWMRDKERWGQVRRRRRVLTQSSGVTGMLHPSGPQLVLGSTASLPSWSRNSPALFFCIWACACMCFHMCHMQSENVSAIDRTTFSTWPNWLFQGANVKGNCRLELIIIDWSVTDLQLQLVHQQVCHLTKKLGIVGWKHGNNMCKTAWDCWPIFDQGLFDLRAK